MLNHHTSSQQWEVATGNHRAGECQLVKDKRPQVLRSSTTRGSFGKQPHSIWHLDWTDNYKQCWRWCLGKNIFPWVFQPQFHQVEQKPPALRDSLMGEKKKERWWTQRFLDDEFLNIDSRQHFSQRISCWYNCHLSARKWF